MNGQRSFFDVVQQVLLSKYGLDFFRLDRPVFLLYLIKRNIREENEDETANAAALDAALAFHRGGIVHRFLICRVYPASAQ